MRRLLFILLFPVYLFAQENYFRFPPNVLYDQPEALRKAGIKRVKCIFRDSRNLTWIGTQNGLFRFDGTNVIYVKYDQDKPQALPNNNIVSIAEDGKGNIWIGTMGGVVKMNPYSLRGFVYCDSLHNLYGDFDNKLISDENGEVWTANSKGLQLYNVAENKFKTVWFDQLGNQSSASYVTCIINYGKDSLAAGTFSDFFIISNRTFKYRRITLPGKKALVTCLAKDSYNHLWIGTWSNGCFVADYSLNHFNNFKWEKDISGDINNIVFGLTVTNNARPLVWINSGKTLFKISYNSSFEPEFAHPNLFINSIKEQERISYMLPDNEGFIWIGYQDGIIRFSSEQGKFKPLQVQINGYVEDMQQLRLNNADFIAISSWHGSHGLCLLDINTSRVKYYSGFPDSSIDNSNISGISKDRFNRLWVSTLGGVCVLNDRMKLLYDFKRDAKDPNCLSAFKTNGVFINNDTAWVFCYKKCIDLYDMNFHKLKSFYPGNSGFNDDLFWRMLRDHSGNLWFCGDNFFYKYLPSTKLFRKYHFNKDHSKYNPADIAELSNGTLVIATQSGLIHFNPFNETFERITTPLLPKEDNIISVCSGANDDIWYLTPDHLIQYLQRSRQFTIFGKEDGLDVQGGLQFIRQIDGKRFLLAQGNNIVEFYPGQWKNQLLPPDIFLNSVQVNDSLVNAEYPVKELKLDFLQNKIYVEFDGITYNKAEQNVYAYMLSGIDKMWVTGNKNFASYANLSPGSYDLHMKVANYAGTWSPEYKIHITIKPPFWLTWWFILSVALLAGTIFYFIIRYVSQRNLHERILILEKEQAVEKERNRIAGDMHDDLGSGLTKIAILSEVAKAQLGEKEAVSAQLEKISFTSRELVDSLQDIIWVLNPRNDSLENLAAYIREYALNFFDATLIKIQFDYPNHIPGVKLSEEQRRNTFLVIKESLNNILKHAGCTSVIIKLLVQENNIQLTIKDDGKGFNSLKVRGFANGLKNMKARMEQISGSIDIRSVENGGTFLILTIPF